MKTALITGGAKRVGRAITERLARAGYVVAIHCNGSLEEARALEEVYQKEGSLDVDRLPPRRR